MLFPRYSKILAKNIEISLEEDSFILIATDCHAKWGGGLQINYLTNFV